MKSSGTRSPQEITKLEAWIGFEREVYEDVKRMVQKGKLALSPSAASIFHRKAYHSRDRGDDIVFDIAVEARVNPSSEISLLWLWECKDYPKRKVKVDEVEEFYAKLQQVGAHKGTVVTRVGFEAGATNFATSKGIGLATCRKVLQRYTYFDSSSEDFEEVVIRCDEGVMTNGKVFEPAAFLELRQMIAMEISDCGTR